MKIKIGNGFFGMMAALAATTVLNTASAQRPEKRVSFHDNKVSVVLQDGWVKSERKGDQLIAGFESSDERSSVFFTLAAAGNRAEMKDIENNGDAVCLLPHMQPDRDQKYPIIEPAEDWESFDESCMQGFDYLKAHADKVIEDVEREVGVYGRRRRAPE